MLFSYLCSVHLQNVPCPAREGAATSLVDDQLSAVTASCSSGARRMTASAVGAVRLVKFTAHSTASISSTPAPPMLSAFEF